MRYQYIVRRNHHEKKRLFSVALAVFGIGLLMSENQVEAKTWVSGPPIVSGKGGLYHGYCPAGTQNRGYASGGLIVCG